MFGRRGDNYLIVTKKYYFVKFLDLWHDSEKGLILSEGALEYYSPHPRDDSEICA
ncbi:hypothetical protein K435DRAFT_782702 [Dendrothele bispora CBS 962.96]|uniref:Uncharacterized protein n=1 Tax=Dendrothele bispora (strain CBS 962.96) TaxID=1314807 RepID=A0A4S8LDH2_DENBC|nr:hypothetical protein K435DRAFT_782702 [Dendrothele bispora CBS 962.96]